jgi:hypothetical protein
MKAHPDHPRLVKCLNRICHLRTGWFLIFLTAGILGLSSSAVGQDSSKGGKRKIARVFILAGQSNMQGQGVVDLNHPEYYNGGKGTLNQVMQEPANRKLMAHLKNADGSWTVRDDVWVWHQTKTELKTGGLTIGFTGYGGNHHIGPELQFGHVVGDALDEPVLLIKTAWGGKSLVADFRPPSSGGEVGPYFIKMLEEIGVAMEKAPLKFPELKDHELVISGFVWQQGWNDMINEQATAEYETNLLNFISDIRRQFGTPKLPFVIGELGNGGENAGESMKKFRAAQAAVAKHGDPNVVFVKTASFARPAEASPNVGHGHHWFGNAESYFLVGDALGKAMVEQLGR